MFRTAILAVAVLCALTINAEARKRTVVADPGCNVIFPCAGVEPSPRGERIAKQVGFGAAQKVYKPRADATIVPHPSGCPSRAFCACGAAVRLLGAPIRSLWPAVAWFRFPRAAPAPNMAGVRPHHVVALISHVSGSRWMVYDANSGGHATRIHEVDISRYTIVNPHS